MSDVQSLEILFAEAKGLVRPAVTDGDASLPHRLVAAMPRPQVDNVLATIADEPNADRQEKLGQALTREIQDLQLHPTNAFELIETFVSSMEKGNRGALQSYIAKGVWGYLQCQSSMDFAEFYDYAQLHSTQAGPTILSFIRPGQVGLAAQELVQIYEADTEHTHAMRDFITLSCQASRTTAHRDAVASGTLTQAFGLLQKEIDASDEDEDKRRMYLSYYAELYNAYGDRGLEQLGISQSNLLPHAERLAEIQAPFAGQLLLHFSAVALNRAKPWEEKELDGWQPLIRNTVSRLIREAGTDSSGLHQVISLCSKLSQDSKPSQDSGWTSAAADGVAMAASQMIKGLQFSPLLALTLTCKLLATDEHGRGAGGPVLPDLFHDKLRRSWREGLNTTVSREAFLRYVAQEQRRNQHMGEMIDTVSAFLREPTRTKESGTGGLVVANNNGPGPG